MSFHGGSREEGRLSVLIDHDILAFLGGFLFWVYYYGHGICYGMGWAGFHGSGRVGGGM
jgi:hypothetical protein